MPFDEAAWQLTTLANQGRDLIDLVLQFNQRRSAEFCSEEMRGLRDRFAGEFPVDIHVMKCMDGRLLFPRITGIPSGVAEPYRTMGGKFSLGHPFFNELMRQNAERARGVGRKCLFIITYHYSRSDTQLGCRGFDYDLTHARSASQELCNQFNQVFGGLDQFAYPVVMGIETDLDALVVHGTDFDQQIDTNSIGECTKSSVNAVLRGLYPEMDGAVLECLLELVYGNVLHVANVRKTERAPLELRHCERIIAIGRGFGWMHCPNLAIIHGPYAGSDDETAVEVAAKIVLDNIRSGRVNSHQALLLVSALSHDEPNTFGWRLAQQKARVLHEMAERVITTRVPELVPHLRGLVGVLHRETQLLTPL